MFRTRHAVSLRLRFTFPFVIPPLSSPKLGEVREATEGYVKKSGERGTKKHTPSGALLLVPLTQRDKVDGHVKLETLKHESRLTPTFLLSVRGGARRAEGSVKMSGERMSDEFSVFRFPFSPFRLSYPLRPAGAAPLS